MQIDTDVPSAGWPEADLLEWIARKIDTLQEEVYFRNSAPIVLVWGCIRVRNDAGQTCDVQDPELLLKVGEHYYPLSRLTSTPPLLNSQFVRLRSLGVID